MSRPIDMYYKSNQKNENQRMQYNILRQNKSQNKFEFSREIDNTQQSNNGKPFSIDYKQRAKTIHSDKSVNISNKNEKSENGSSSWKQQPFFQLVEDFIINQQICYFKIHQLFRIKDYKIQNAFNQILSFIEEQLQEKKKLVKIIEQLSFQNAYLNMGIKQRQEGLQKTNGENVKLKNKLLNTQNKYVGSLNFLYFQECTLKKVKSTQKLVTQPTVLSRVSPLAARSSMANLLTKQVEINKEKQTDKEPVKNEIPEFQTSAKSKFAQVVQKTMENHILKESKLQNSQNFLKDKEFMTYRDFIFFRIFLDIQTDDIDIKHMFNSNNNLIRFKKYIDNEEFTDGHNLNINDEFKSLALYSLAFLQNFLEMGLKMKNLLRAEAKIHSSLQLAESFKLIVSETCLILNCDRASVFLIDRQKEELWARSQVGGKTIRFSMKQGIAGYVANSGKNLNIQDAYSDKRFNAEVDKLQNYKTKTILCVPIKDADQTNIIGVIQAINKKDGYFTRDDEGLILLLSYMASNVFRNSLYHDGKTVVQNNLRKLVEAGIVMSKCKSIPRLFSSSENILVDEFNIPEARIYVFNAEKKVLVRYVQGEEQLEVGIESGIVGKVFKEGREHFTTNCYCDSYFNSLVDIDTKMPVLTLPIREDEQKAAYGVVQVIDKKGIANIQYQISNQLIKTPLHETLKTFMEIFIHIYELLLE